MLSLSNRILPSAIKPLNRLSRYLSHDSRASSKLFADAEREEAQVKPKSSHLLALEQQHENWTGDEKIEDTVLRMLVDKYKPLRSGAVQTAEQKLKTAVPEITVIDNVETPKTSSVTRPSSGSWATESLLPSVEGHRPWHTEYKVPSHVLSSVKSARLPPSPSHRKSSALKEKKDKQALRRTGQALRLDRARETTLDYRLGLKRDAANAPANSTVNNHVGPRPNPKSLEGWTGLIEDQIEVCDSRPCNSPRD